MKENKLKKILDLEISRALNKYNSAVFILQGGTVTEAVSRFGDNGPRLPAQSLRRLCFNADSECYDSLREVAKWCGPEDIARYGEDRCMGEPTLNSLRSNKQLFIGEP
jgi:hypothetical protein